MVFEAEDRAAEDGTLSLMCLNKELVFINISQKIIFSRLTSHIVIDDHDEGIHD